MSSSFLCICLAVPEAYAIAAATVASLLHAASGPKFLGFQNLLLVLSFNSMSESESRSQPSESKASQIPQR